MVGPRNCEESESDKAIEYFGELNCFDFPPSPTYFPLFPTTFPPSPSYSPLYLPPSPPLPFSSNSSIVYVSDGVYLVMTRNHQHEDNVDYHLAILVEYKIQERDGAWDVIPSGRLVRINELVEQLDDIVDSKATKKALEYMLYWDDFEAKQNKWLEYEPLEKQNEDIVDQLVVDSVDVQQYLFQYSGGALDTIRVGKVARINGSEMSEGELLTSTPEPALIFQTKLSIRLWQGYRGQWAADICFEWNWLNIGTLKIAEGAPLSYESVLRFRGGKDLFDYPFSELIVNENRAEPATMSRTEIQMLELPPIEEEENPDEDFDLGCSKATGNDGVEAEATRNDGVEVVGMGNWSGCGSTPIQVSQSTLKYACREYGIHISTPMLVYEEEIPLLSATLPSDQTLAATVDTNSVLVKEITPSRSSPVARQENPDEDFVSGQVEPVGIGSEGTKEAEYAEPQLNSGPSGKRKRKEKTPRGERGNKKATGVRNVIRLEDISQIKEMHLKEAARHLNVSKFALKRACQEHGIKRWPPCNIHETHAVLDEEGLAPLTSDTLHSDQALTAIVDTNSVAEEITSQQFLPTVRQEKPDEDSGSDEVGMGAVGIGEGDMQRNEKAPRGERGGVRIVLSLEEVLRYKDMRIEDAARDSKLADLH